jgi:hypothetical protein
MHADDTDPRKTVTRLLRRRPGWSFQATSTPGAPLVWCFGSGGAVELSVTVDDHAIHVHVSAADDDIEVADADELAQWLRAHRAGTLQEPRTGLVEKIKSGRFFKWD